MSVDAWGNERRVYAGGEWKQFAVNLSSSAVQRNVANGVAPLLGKGPDKDQYEREAVVIYFRICSHRMPFAFEGFGSDLRLKYYDGEVK